MPLKMLYYISMELYPEFVYNILYNIVFSLYLYFLRKHKHSFLHNICTYFLYIYLNLFSEDKKELKYNIEKIEGILQSRGLQTRRSTFREEQLFISCLPLQENKKEIKQWQKEIF